jgi:dihydrofolate reductase
VTPLDGLPPPQGVSLIVAVAAGGAIGRGGTLPWHAPEDLAHFRRVTTGHTLVVGRATWESIGRPLPGRRFVVVTSSPAPLPDGVEAASTPEGAVARALATDATPLVAGGAAVYEALAPLVARAYVTEIDEVVEGADRWFSLPEPESWRELACWRGSDPRLTFRVLERAQVSRSEVSRPAP